MHAAHLTAFTDAIRHVLGVMLQLDASIDEPLQPGPDLVPIHVCCEIEVSGDVRGRVVLGFPQRTAQRLATMLTGDPGCARHAQGWSDDDLQDAMGELSDIIRGRAAARWPECDATWCPPRVSLGEAAFRDVHQNGPCVACVTECGDLFLAAATESEREPSPIGARP